MKTIMFTWDQYFELVQKMVDEVKEKYSDHSILALSRGGLIPATIISHQINKPIDVLNVFSYNNKNRQEDIKIGPFSGWQNGVPKKILIVDDLIDSGNTLFKVYLYIAKKSIYEGLSLHDMSIKSVVLIDKCESIIKPNFSYMQMSEPAWITFPYEVK